jgi:hypothetical protein
MLLLKIRFVEGRHMQMGWSRVDRVRAPNAHRLVWFSLSAALVLACGSNDSTNGVAGTDGGDAALAADSTVDMNVGVDGAPQAEGASDDGPSDSTVTDSSQVDAPDGGETGDGETDGGGPADGASGDGPTGDEAIGDGATGDGASSEGGSGDSGADSADAAPGDASIDAAGGDARPPDGSTDAQNDAASADAGDAGPCGLLDASCCPGSSCNGAAICDLGVCRICGDPGEACCQLADGGTFCPGGGCCSGGACVASGENTGAATVCSNGASVPCGADNQHCCQQNGCSNPDSCCGNGSVCNPSMVDGGAVACPGTSGCYSGHFCNSVGAACGGAGEPCCLGSPGCAASGLACDPWADGGNLCTHCGGPGEVCCDGNACASGGCCDPSTHHCVGDGTACSGSNGMCSGGGCMAGACGTLHGPCCNFVCTAPYTKCGGTSCLPCGGHNEVCCTVFGPGLGAGTYCDPTFTCGSGICQ